jgi:hypothetical protein
MKERLLKSLECLVKAEGLIAEANLNAWDEYEGKHDILYNNIIELIDEYMVETLRIIF